MASSVIKNTMHIVVNYSSATRELILSTVNKVAMLYGSIFSGTSGISEDQAIIAYGIDASYCPSATVKCLADGSDGHLYWFRVTTGGSLLALMNVPANVTLNFFCSWKF